jgi:hypothetical protein
MAITAVVVSTFLATLVAVCLTVVTVVALARDTGGDDVERIADLLEELSAYPDDVYEWDEGYGEEWDDGFTEDGYVVEDEDVVDATDEPCRDLVDAAASLPFLSPQDPVPALGALRDAVGSIISAIDDTGADDSATEAWRDDLAELQSQLETAVATATAGEVPELDVSSDDLAFRMYWGSPIGCEPPLRLVALDPDFSLLDAGGSSGYAL